MSPRKAAPGADEDRAVSDRRPSGRVVGGLSLGLVLGMLGGWVAGLLRAPRPEPRR